MYSYYQQQPAQRIMPGPQGLKGRPVSSVDEVKATPVDFDGSIFYFPNLANNKIFTKQVNLDGTSLIRVYELVETPIQLTSQPFIDENKLVTKEEFSTTIQELLKEISALKQQSLPQNKDNETEFNF